MSNDVIDNALAAAARQQRRRRPTHEWATIVGSTVLLKRWLINGKSGATVAVVTVQNKFDGAREVVLKLDDTGEYERAEYTQQLKARADAPQFADRHLATAVDRPIRVGDGRWIALQQVAGGSLRQYGVLTTLLDTATAPDADEESGRVFARACREVVRSALAEWAVFRKRSP